MPTPTNQLYNPLSFAAQFGTSPGQQYPGGANYPTRPGTTQADLYQTPPGGQDTGFSMPEYLQAGSGVVQSYLGLEGLGQAKDNEARRRQEYGLNLANQAQLINNQQEARKRAALETSGRFAQNDAGRASLNTELQTFLEPRKVSGKLT